MGNPVALLKTERLILRGWQESDFSPYAALNADAEVMEFFPESMHLDAEQSREQAERFSARIEANGFGQYALELCDGGDFIGFTGLNPMPEGQRGSGDICLNGAAARSAWGHGFATEAGLASVVFAFDELGLDEIFSMTAVLNLRSQAVMTRLGFSRWKIFDHPKVKVGHRLRPHICYRRISDLRNGRPSDATGSHEQLGES